VVVWVSGRGYEKGGPVCEHCIIQATFWMISLDDP
jgi:hypothetical protein